MPATYREEDCPKCGAAVYDNTENKRNPKAPDFKCSDKDCDFVVWPPRGRGNQQAARRSEANSSPPSRGRSGDSRSGDATTPRGNDDRSNRIERQHSQEMALRYIDIKQMDSVDTETVRKLTDWFQRDIGRAPAVQATEPVSERARESDPGDIGGEPQPPDDDEPPF